VIVFVGPCLVFHVWRGNITFLVKGLWMFVTKIFAHRAMNCGALIFKLTVDVIILGHDFYFDQLGVGLACIHKISVCVLYYDVFWRLILSELLVPTANYLFV